MNYVYYVYIHIQIFMYMLYMILRSSFFCRKAPKHIQPSALLAKSDRLPGGIRVQMLGSWKKHVFVVAGGR